MSELVIMPFADWKAALEATRHKTGKNEPIKSGELAAEIESISVGGGGGGEFVSVLPEQWIDTPYTEGAGCYYASIPLDNNDGKYGGETDDCYVAWVDGVAYALPLTDYKININNGALTGTLRVFGNPGIQTSVQLGDAIYPQECEDGWRTEPFNFSINDDSVTFRASEGTRHKVRIGYVPQPEFTVTFHVNGEVKYTQTVKGGESCPDPIVSGRIAPIDPIFDGQSINEYLGWSTTNGGAVDTSVLEKVTQNIDMYAVFVTTTIDTTQTCGTSAYWAVTPTNTLYICGSGKTKDYAYYSTRPWDADYKTTIQAIYVFDGITSIGNSLFYELTSATSVRLPEGITSIGQYAMQYCSSLTKIEVPASVKTIESHAFSRCTNVTQIILPDGLTTLGNSAFYACSALTSMQIPSGVTRINNGTFGNCTALKSISIPATVKVLDQRILYSCDSLTSVSFADTSGWRVNKSSETAGTGWTNITVTSPSTNATNLKGTYNAYYWKDQT